tara:strand:- start:9 stop:542 length:534 start_codon:yes stop_codon:yes gene_type:complete
VIPLLFFATCGEPEIFDDWSGEFDVVEQVDEETSEIQVYQATGTGRFVYRRSHGGQMSFNIPEGWQTQDGTEELVVTATHLSSGTRMDFYLYDLQVGLPVPRSDCDWGYLDSEAASPFSGVESVLLTSCLLRESGDRVQALGFEQSGGLWQIETQLKVGYLALGLEVSEELLSGVAF